MGNKKTVLVVDDQANMRLMLSHYLSYSYNVVEKSSAKEALTYLKEGNTADAIIMDILMPEMTGIEFLSVFQEPNITSKVPVLMLSSIENSSEKMRCFNYGARDYVTKPFNPQELSVRLKNLL